MTKLLNRIDPLARLALVALTGLLGLAALLAVPSDNDPAWVLTLVGSKAAAAALFWLCHRIGESLGDI